MQLLDQLIDEDIIHIHKNKEIVNFVFGCLSGVSNCLSGYVFDTVKVKMQTDANAQMINTFRNVIKHQGFISLFNGIYYPLVTIPVVNGIIFGSYQFYKKQKGKKELSFKDGIQNGAFSGLVNSIVVSPVELVKCVMQAEKQNKYQNSRECLRQIIKRQGLRGPFKGMFSTIVREVPAYAGQFATYQMLKGYLTNQHKKCLTFVEASVVGGISGISCWICSYPQDLIKTKLQVSYNLYQRHKFIPDGGFFQCAKQIYKKAGFIGFWRGVTPCMIRAFVANSCGIVTYEKLQQQFHHSSLN